jgi:NAD(P)-dependent dehydrogenase (short-subunit alcohol dehydrogenase family)
VLNRSDKVEELEAVSSQLLQTNVVGNIHLFHLFLPLVLKGKVKKVITISTGMADLDLTNDCEVDVGALYAASKAAMNVIVAKFNAQYKKDGVLFMSISPGLVEVGRYADCTYPFLCTYKPATSGRFINAYISTATPEEIQGLTAFMGKLVTYAPHFKGPITPEESVRHVRSTWEKASIEGGFGGAFVSHLGNKQWV